MIELTQAQIDSIVELYIGYLLRAPEYAGLQYHIDIVEQQMDAGASFALKAPASGSV